MLYPKSIRCWVVQGGCAVGVVQDRIGLCRGLCEPTLARRKCLFSIISSTMSGLCKPVDGMFPSLELVVQGFAGGVPRILLDRILFRSNIVA